MLGADEASYIIVPFISAWIFATFQNPRATFLAEWLYLPMHAGRRGRRRHVKGAVVFKSCHEGAAFVEPNPQHSLHARIDIRELRPIDGKAERQVRSPFRSWHFPGPFRQRKSRMGRPRLLGNRAAAIARGRMPVFPNDDAALVETYRLAVAAGLARHQACSAVAAKLLYPSGWRQRGGSVVGPDGAAQIEIDIAPDHPGYAGQLDVMYEVSAARGACMAVEKVKFAAAGRIAWSGIPVEPGDAGPCLRLGPRDRATIAVGDLKAAGREAATRLSTSICTMCDG